MTEASTYGSAVCVCVCARVCVVCRVKRLLIRNKRYLYDINTDIFFLYNY